MGWVQRSAHFQWMRSNHTWLTRQAKDPYVKLAREHNYRARSAFKLLEIDRKFKLITPDCVAVDLGAAPGAWTQVLVQRSQSTGLIIGVDLLPTSPIEGATLLSNSDITDPATVQRIQDLLQGRPVDLVLSDMAPNACGDPGIDHERIVDLCESALSFALLSLRDGGHFVCKLWDGYRRAGLERACKARFKCARWHKPPASRDASAEMYLVAKGLINR